MKIYVVCRESCPIDSNYVEKTFDNLYEDIPPVAGRFLGPIDDLEKAEDLRKKLADDFVDTAVYIHNNDFWWRMVYKPNGAWAVQKPEN